MRQSKKGEEKKKVFVMGDRAEDIFLIPQYKYTDVNLSMNSDLFTRDLIQSYQKRAGAYTLLQLLQKFDNIRVADDKNETCTLKTISEWSRKGDGLYLEKHIGLIKSNDSEEGVALAGSAVKSFNASDIIAAYNMSDSSYFSEDQFSRIQIKKDGVMVLRTMFRDMRKETVFLQEICKKKFAKQTVLLFNINELRRGGYNIKKGVSWEQLTLETENCIKSIAGHDEFMAIVVCFNHEGCLVYRNNECHLIFFAGEIEGDYVIKNQKRAFSPIISMQATIIHTLARDGVSKQSILDAVTKGVMIMRELINMGFTLEADYPYEKVSELIERPLDEYGDKTPDMHCFSPVTEKISFLDSDTIKHTELLDLCKEIVRNGKINSKAVPYLRYNKLLTYDRLEIEELRNIYSLFRLYIKDNNLKKPISICVFGTPGSGKSFAVKQIADSVRIKNKVILEFNLSQMSSPHELARAFHQIRDAGLKNQMPIAFFDEFDSILNGVKLGWLKYFLAPMQDGEFHEEVVAHFIGRAIFVFAGGTCSTMEEFIQKNQRVPRADSDGSDMQQPADNKVQDFLSRLRGYFNVSGPNPKECTYYSNCEKKSAEECGKSALEYLCAKQEGRPAKTSKAEDRKIELCPHKGKYCHNFGHYLRRATLLRSMLENKLKCRDSDLIEIDDEVLNAFLRVQKYLHGARSLEAIIQMSDITRGRRISAPCINNNCLDLYVTPDFSALLDKTSDV